MPQADPLADASFGVLRRLAGWLAAAPFGEDVASLVGGWAVHSYSPYAFSIDIDVIIRSRPRSSLAKALPSWGLHRRDPRPGIDANVWQLPTGSERPVDLELYGTGKRTENTFFRDRRQAIPWALALERSSPRDVSWGTPPGTARLRVVDADLLFLYKLKAYDDRGLRMAAGGESASYLRSKRSKDASDLYVLSRTLLDRADFDLVSKWMGRLPFLLEVYLQAARDRGPREYPLRLGADDFPRVAEELVGHL